MLPATTCVEMFEGVPLIDGPLLVCKPRAAVVLVGLGSVLSAGGGLDVTRELNDLSLILFGRVGSAVLPLCCNATPLIVNDPLGPGLGVV